MIRITAILFSGALLFHTGSAAGGAVRTNPVPAAAASVKIRGINYTAESPFLDENFKYGTVAMKSGRVIPGVRFRINLVTNETECLFATGFTAMLAKGSVKEISYTDTTESGQIFYRIKTGYPPFDKQTRDHFYIVLSEGRCNFLRSVEKKLAEKVNDLNRSISQEYETQNEYYFFSNGSVKRWKKEKEFVLAELADKEEQVNKFMLENKTNFRNLENVTALLNYYNSL
jgi:hypothetical protein